MLPWRWPPRSATSYCALGLSVTNSTSNNGLIGTCFAVLEYPLSDKTGARLFALRAYSPAPVLLCDGTNQLAKPSKSHELLVGCNAGQAFSLDSRSYVII